MRAGLVAIAAFLAAAAPVAAQDFQRPIDEDAADLAYGFCPLYLAGRFSLTGPELEQRGFGKTVVKQAHARVGEMSMVTARKADGEIAFGGAEGKACTVVVTSPKRAQVLARLHANLAFMGLDFEPAPSPGPNGANVPGLIVETFKAPVGGQFLYVQIIQAGATGPVVAQLFATEK